jgi:hypothetical protein
MAIDHNDREDRQARLDVMIEEFRAARRRRSLKNTVMKKPVEADERAMVCVKPLPADKAR